MIDEKTKEDYRLFRTYISASKIEPLRRKKLNYSVGVASDPNCPNNMDLVKLARRSQGEAKIRLKEYLYLNRITANEQG